MRKWAFSILCALVVLLVLPAAGCEPDPVPATSRSTASSVSASANSSSAASSAFSPAAGSIKAASDQTTTSTSNTTTTSKEAVTTSAAASTTASPSNTAALLVWVRDDEAIVNVNQDPLEFDSTEARFLGSYSHITVSETGFTTRECYIDNKDEYYNVTVSCRFETPPLVLNPGLRYKVTADFSNGGQYIKGGEGVGEQFWYSSSPRGYVEPATVLPYYPWSPSFNGMDSQDWMIEAPPASKGATFQVYAGLWNRPPCNVTWTYRCEYH